MGVVHMDVMHAAFLVAHDFKPNGATGLARQMGVPAGTFLNRVNPEQETHTLPVGMAVAMSIAAQDFRILHAFADTCGFVAFKKPDLSNVSDASLLEMMLKRDRAEGDFAQVLAMSLENGQVSSEEVAEIEREAYEAAAAMLELVERIRGLVRDR